MHWWKWVGIYYLGLNLITAALFYMDKAKAKKHKYRIPEKTLFLFIMLGGQIGALFGMFGIHHKNRKARFYLVTLLFLLIHGAMWFWLLR